MKALFAESLPRPDLSPITDAHGRLFHYLRVAVNEKCHLRCIYCMPETGMRPSPKNALLSSEEILRVIAVLSRVGVEKIRFTGGEPLLRADLVSLVRQAARTPGVKSVHVTTNGLWLDRYLEPLLEAGLHGINISLDTLRPERYRRITRRPGHEIVTQNIRRALDAERPDIKINVVVLRGVNDDEFVDFIELTRDDPLTVRFIELMPFDDRQIWRTGRFLSAETMLERFRKTYPDLETLSGANTEQHTFRRPGHKGRFAVIPAFTRSLCSDCSRIRLTADGKIRNCLFTRREFELKNLLRGGASDEAVLDRFREAMSEKSRDGWEAQKSAADPIHPDRTSMTQIGG